MTALYSTLGTFVPDNLIVGNDVPQVIKPVTLKAGQGTLKRGSVLGLIKKAVGTITPGATNTAGSGTIASFTLGATAKIGSYVLTCITKVANAGVFSVIDPDGIRLKDATVAVAYAGALNFTITDATDFEVGDSFTLTVVAGSGQAVLVNDAAVDGSQIADSILAVETVVPAAATVVQEAYSSGHFNRKALTFGGNDVAADHEDVLRDKGIILSDAIAY